MAQNRVIGKRGAMPWGNVFKEDLKFFKNITYNNTIIIGRKTLEALPILVKRKCIALTQNLSTDVFQLYEQNNYKFDDLYIRRYEEENWDNIENKFGKCIVCGGAQIYNLLLPCIDVFYVTILNENYDGDTFMIPFEHLYVNKAKIQDFDRGSIWRYSHRLWSKLA